MISDLDRLMAERDLDALFVTGSTRDNPTMYYLANGARVGEHTLAVKQRGADPVLIAIGMERDEAAKSGLEVIPRSRYKFQELLKASGGDMLAAETRLVEAIFADRGISGRVGIYGRAERGHTLAFVDAMRAHANGVTIVGETTPTVFDQAWLTKDAGEIARIRSVADAALTVVGNTRDFLASHRAAHGALVRPDGQPLTVGDVKAMIRRWTVENNLEDPEGAIFAIGRDSAVPHSHGEDTDIIELGKTIVFDFFPREAGGGYFYDFTRTWCVGYAPPEVEQLYAQVQQAFDLAMDTLAAGQPCRDSQNHVNEFFESLGHPTTHSHPGTTEGYVHSLGHGVGLSVHERPVLSEYSQEEDVLLPGMVLTVEPGLYYPDKGYGARIEDYVWLNPETRQFETIGEFDKELVIPVVD